MPYLLLFLGVLFYTPKLVWDYFEDDKMNQIAKGIKVGLLGPDYEEKIANVASNVSKYIKMPEGGHVTYGWGYILANIWNLGVIALSAYLIDGLLGNIGQNL